MPSPSNTVRCGITTTPKQTNYDQHDVHSLALSEIEEGRRRLQCNKRSLTNAANMGFMSFLRDDRVALIGMGVAAVALISSMMAVVTMVIEDNKIERSEPKTQYITQETEDSLQLETLEKLINHPSYSIREVAVKILCDRAVNDDDTVHILLHGITRTDYDYRLQCLKALALLLSQTGGKALNLPLPF